jgi:serine protease Do
MTQSRLQRLPDKCRPSCILAMLPACALLVVLSSSAVRAQSADARREEPRTDELRKLNESVNALIKRVSPSVVQILVTGYGPLEGEHGNAASVIGRQRAIGSGFVIDSSGYIVTNAHVVNGAQRVQVVLPPTIEGGSLRAALSTRTTIVPARIVGVARDVDLALIKVDAEKLPALALVTTANWDKANWFLRSGARKGCAIR